MHALKEQLALPLDASFAAAVRGGNAALGIEAQGSLSQQVAALLTITGITAVAGTHAAYQATLAPANVPAAAPGPATPGTVVGTKRKGDEVSGLHVVA